VRAALDKVGLLPRERRDADRRSPAANSSGCASRAPSCTGPIGRCCSPTSRPATSMPTMRAPSSTLRVLFHQVGVTVLPLSTHAAIGRYQFVAKAMALEDLKKAAGLSGIVEELGRNPLPDAFVVTGRPDGAEALEALRSEAAKWPGVDHAQLDTLWARQVEAVIRGGRMVVVILGTLLGVALVAITFNTIRLQILGRREEIEVSKLIGATNAFIRRPFLYLGTLQGLIGACIAWGLVMFAVGVLEHELGIQAGEPLPAAQSQGVRNRTP
jgi:hypothetical protein